MYGFSIRALVSLCSRRLCCCCWQNTQHSTLVYIPLPTHACYMPCYVYNKAHHAHIISLTTCPFSGLYEGTKKSNEERPVSRSRGGGNIYTIRLRTINTHHSHDDFFSFSNAMNSERYTRIEKDMRCQSQRSKSHDLSRIIYGVQSTAHALMYMEVMLMSGRFSRGTYIICAVCASDLHHCPILWHVCCVRVRWTRTLFRRVYFCCIVILRVCVCVWWVFHRGCFQSMRAVTSSTGLKSVLCDFSRRKGTGPRASADQTVNNLRMRVCVRRPHHRDRDRLVLI